MVRAKLNSGCRYSTPVRERPLHPTRSQFTPEASQTQAPVTPATEPEQCTGGGLTTLFEDKHCAIDTIRSLRKMKPIRQVEAAELMIAMNNYTVPYAKALLASTTPDQLLETAAPKSSKGITPEQLAQLQREMDSLNRGIKSIEATYGSDHLYLVLAAGYVRSLLENALTVRYLRRHHPEILEEFVRIVEATAIASEAAE